MKKYTIIIAVSAFLCITLILTGPLLFHPVKAPDTSELQSTSTVQDTGETTVSTVQTESSTAEDTAEDTTLPIADTAVPDSTAPSKQEPAVFVPETTEGAASETTEAAPSLPPTTALPEPTTAVVIPEITEVLFYDTLYYPYYGILSDAGQQFYRLLYANAIALDPCVLPDFEISSEDAVMAVECLLNDHPELFWLEPAFTYYYSPDGLCAMLNLEFNTTADNIAQSKAAFDAAAQPIIQQASTLETAYEKEKYVHDALLDRIEYSDDAALNQGAYSALVYGQTVCAGYAKAFQYIMTQLSIPTYYVVGTAETDHAWNMVLLNDGFYNVDITWDDNISSKYAFFNVADPVFSETHYRTDLSVYLPDCTGNAYAWLEGVAPGSQPPENFQSSSLAP